MLNSAAATLMEVEESFTETVLQGFAASGGIVEGPCRVITDIAQLAKIEKDAILVFPTSAPEIAVVMTRLAGLVTAEGGRLGGASSFAREQCTPCVTGVKGSMDVISDGQVIRVDGFEGTVTLL